MNWQQVIIAIWLFSSVARATSKNGQTVTYKASGVGTIALAWFLAWVLYKAGFWN